MAENLQIVIGAKDEFSGTFARLQNMLPRMRTLIIAAAGAVAGATTAIGAMVKTTATAHDEVQKFSDQLGISTEFISRMQVAAEFSGVEVETMRKAIQRLQVGIGEANRGIGLSKDAFNDLGITLRGTSGELKTSEELMPELAEKLAGVTSATERAELASKLFGQRGISMIQILGKGKDSLEAMWKEADQLGLTVGSVAAKQAAEFNDSLTRVKGALTGVKNTIAEALIPQITAMANGFSVFVRENRDSIVKFAQTATGALTSIGTAGVYAAAALVDSWHGLGMLLNTIKLGFADLNKVTLDAAASLVEFAIKIKGMFSGIKLGPEAEAANKAIKKMAGEQTDSLIDLRAKIQAAAEYYRIMGENAETSLLKTSNYKMAISSASEWLAKLREINAETIKGPTMQAPTMGAMPAKIDMSKEQKDAFDKLLALRDEYILTDMAKVEKWYTEQVAVLNKLGLDNQQFAEARSALDDVYIAKKSEVLGQESEAQTRRLEMERDAANSLRALHDEYYTSETDRLTAWYEEQRQLFADNKDALITLEETYWARMTELQVNAGLAAADITVKGMSDQKKAMAELDKAGWKFAESGFKAAKALSIPKTIMDTYSAAVGAYNAMASIPYIGPILGAIAAAAAIAFGMAQVASIKSTTFGGAAHGGLDYVPAEQTYLLEKGERVLSPKQNIDLMNFLKEQKKNIALSASTVMSAISNFANLAIDKSQTVQMQTLQSNLTNFSTTTRQNETSYAIMQGDRITTQNKEQRTSGNIEVANQTLNLNIMPNVHTAEMLLALRKDDWARIAEEAIVPAFRRLKLNGVLV